MQKQQGEHEHRQDVIDRLSKIEGHIRSIKQMLKDEKPCDQILIQMASVRSAFAGATKVLLEDHFDTCIVAQNEDPALDKELRDFRKLLGSFVR